MAAVTFYRFAAAIMELLEPEKYNFTRNVNNTDVQIDSQIINQESVVLDNVSSNNTENISYSFSQVVNSELSASNNFVATNPRLTIAEDAPLDSLKETTAAIAKLLDSPSSEESQIAASDQINIDQNAVTNNFVAESWMNASETSTVSQPILETVEVQVVAAKLSEAIANASEEKLTKVAEAIKEAAVETGPVTANSPTETTAILQTITTSLSDTSTKTEAAVIVNATIKTLADETTKEIFQSKANIKPVLEISTTNSVDNFQAVVHDKGSLTKTDPSELPRLVTSNPNFQETINFEKTATVTTAITEKIKEKVAETTDNTIGTCSDVLRPEVTNSWLEANTVAKDNSSFKQSIETNYSTDFWELFPELDPAEIKYYHTISYLYDYMKEGSLLDILNPAIDLGERYGLMTFVSQGANDKYKVESDTIQSMQKDRDEAAERLKENEREIRENDQLRQQEQKRWEMLQEQKKLAERIALERLKNLR